jgi:hypothetical protein
MSELREGFLKATMAKRNCSRDEAEIILNRISDRLGGMTHAEAVRANPLPEGRDEACGTTADNPVRRRRS